MHVCVYIHIYIYIYIYIGGSESGSDRESWWPRVYRNDVAPTTF